LDELPVWHKLHVERTGFKTSSPKVTADWEEGVLGSSRRMNIRKNWEGRSVDDPVYRDVHKDVWYQAARAKEKDVKKGGGEKRKRRGKGHPTNGENAKKKRRTHGWTRQHRYGSGVNRVKEKRREIC